MNQDKNKLFASLYYDLNNETAFTSKSKVYKKAKSLNKNIKRKDVELWFQSQYSPGIHKPIKKIQRSKTFVKSPFDQFQIDLADLSNISEHNNDFKHLLVCIDVFTRFLWVVPLKSKHGKIVAEALETIVKKNTPVRIQSDHGTEFWNTNVYKIFTKYKIKHFSTTDFDVKSGLVERVIRTLKDRLWKYFSAQNTYKYLDILENLVKSYNNGVHSATGYKPSQNLTSEDKIRIRQKLYKRRKPFQGYHYNIDDHCRIKVERTKFKKGYLQNFSKEIFTIFNRKIRGNIAVYFLKDLNNVKLKGFFYTEELQKVQLPDTYRVEQILKKQQRKKSTFYFVKWEGYPDSFNSWVHEKDLTSII